MSAISSLISNDTKNTGEKRSVAKKACLSCREKKIKCDGELVISYPSDPDTKTTSYKTCSNCKASGLECVFVPSKRGGRRKRKQGDASETSSIISSTIIPSGIKTHPADPNASSIKFEQNLENGDNSENSQLNSNHPYKQQNYPPNVYPLHPHIQQQLPGPMFPPNQQPYFSDYMYLPYQQQPWQQQQSSQQPPSHQMPFNMTRFPTDMDQNASALNHHPTQPQMPYYHHMPSHNSHSNSYSAQASAPAMALEQMDEKSKEKSNSNSNSNSNIMPSDPMMYHPPQPFNQQMMYQYLQYPYYRPELHNSYNPQMHYSYPPVPFTQTALSSNRAPESQFQQQQQQQQQQQLQRPFLENVIQHSSQKSQPEPHSITTARQQKSIDFEDKNSKHYIDKSARYDASYNVLSEDEVVESSNNSQTNNNDGDLQHNPESLIDADADGDEDADEEVDNEDDEEDALSHYERCNDEHGKDDDSWSLSLAPSDSVTAIGLKKQRLAQVARYENRFQITKEGDNAVSKNNNKNIINTNIQSNQPPPQRLQSNGSGTHSNPSTLESNPSKIKSQESATEISTTERWLSEQSNHLKRSAIENEQEASENKKRIKKYQPLVLDVEFPNFIDEEILKKIDLPDFQTLYKLIGIYYKYYHPHNLILPNMSSFISSLSPSNDYIGLLAAMFKVSSKFMSSHEVLNDLWIDESHWQKLYEKYDDNLSSTFRLASLVIQCQRGDDEYAKLGIELFNSLKLEELILNIPWQKMEDLKSKNVFTTYSLLERETVVRIYWCLYKTYIFRRLSFGYPYKQFPDEPTFKVNKDVELPLPDVKYYLDTNDLKEFKQSFNKKLHISSISTTHPNGSKLFDSAGLVISLNLLEEVMDTISNRSLFSDTLMRFCHRLKKNYEIHHEFKHLQPYQLETHPKKEPHIIVNASNFSSTFINRMTCLIISIELSQDLLLYPVKSSVQIKSQINFFNDLTLVQVEPELIIQKLKLITDQEKRHQTWVWFLKSFDIIQDLLTLLRLGDGVCTASLGETKSIGEIFETVVGPCCSGPPIVEEWCKYNTWTLNTSNVPVENQGWIQMPSYVAWVMIQAWSFLATFAVILNSVDLRFTENISVSQDTGDAGKHFDKHHIDLSENEDEERGQVTKGAGRIDSSEEFRRKNQTRDCNIGGIYDEEAFKQNKWKMVELIDKKTGEKLVSDIPLDVAPGILLKILKTKNSSPNQDNAVLINKIIEQMKIIRKYLGILEPYYGDCKIGCNYCDKIIDYIVELQNRS